MSRNAFQFGPFRSGLVWVGLAAMAVCPSARALEHVTLKNGFELDCVRREAVGDKVRLYLAGNGTTSVGDSNYLEVAADSVIRVETVADPPAPVAMAKMPNPVTITSAPTKEEMHEMLAHAGAAHHIDEDLLASVVRAESGGQVRAVSRTGARGLMQLMPGTASAMGVDDAFKPEQNIAGGTAYLDALLTRYHDNVALALAAYNAGPGAVDKYHGVPPYRETQEYVARVIREFNRRKQMALITQTK
jgi:soluble lytic murein transglycosylase-like protein